MKATEVLIYVFISATIISCSDDRNVEIEAELSPYIQLFEMEASERGLVVNVEELDVSAYVEEILARGTLGQCKTYASGSKSVVIDENYWDGASDTEREYLVFHELGHCVLDKAHDDTATANGTCISIMQSGDHACTAEYNENNRDELLDELFSE